MQEYFFKSSTGPGCVESTCLIFFIVPLAWQLSVVFAVQEFFSNKIMVCPLLVDAYGHVISIYMTFIWKE